MFENTITITLSHDELSSITLALSTAIEAYRAKGTEHGLQWCFGRAAQTRTNLLKFDDLYQTMAEGLCVRLDCIEAIEKAAGFMPYTLRR